MTKVTSQISEFENSRETKIKIFQNLQKKKKKKKKIVLNIKDQIMPKGSCSGNKL